MSLDPILVPWWTTTITCTSICPLPGSDSYDDQTKPSSKPQGMPLIKPSLTVPQNTTWSFTTASTLRWSWDTGWQCPSKLETLMDPFQRMICKPEVAYLFWMYTYLSESWSCSRAIFCYWKYCQHIIAKHTNVLTKFGYN